MRLILILASLMSSNNNPRILKSPKHTLRILIQHILAWADKLYLRDGYLLTRWYIFRWNIYRLYWSLEFAIYLRWGLKNSADLLLEFDNFEGWLRLRLSSRDSRRSNVNCHLYGADLLFILGDELKTALRVILIVHHIEFDLRYFSLLVVTIIFKHCDRALCNWNHTILSLLSSLLGIHN